MTINLTTEPSIHTLIDKIISRGEPDEVPLGTFDAYRAADGSLKLVERK